MCSRILNQLPTCRQPIPCPLPPHDAPPAASCNHSNCSVPQEFLFGLGVDLPGPQVWGWLGNLGDVCSRALGETCTADCKKGVLIPRLLGPGMSPSGRHAHQGTNLLTMQHAQMKRLGRLHLQATGARWDTHTHTHTHSTSIQCQQEGVKVRDTVSASGQLHGAGLRTDFAGHSHQARHPLIAIQKHSPWPASPATHMESNDPDFRNAYMSPKRVKIYNHWTQQRHVPPTPLV